MKYVPLIIFFSFFLSFDQLLSEESPSILTHFLTADEIDNYPNETLRQFSEPDPGYNKVILTPQHFPKNKKITFSTRRLAQFDREYEKKISFYIDEKGEFIDSNTSKGLYSSFIISSRGYLPGEYITAKLSTDDGQLKELVKFAPNPIIVKSKSGSATIFAVLVDFLPIACYHFYFKGFNENESINFFSVSGKEKINKRIQIPSDYMFAYSPDTVDTDEGVGIVTFVRDSGEKMEFYLPWGDAFDDYLKGKKIYQNKL